MSCPALPEPPRGQAALPSTHGSWPRPGHPGNPGGRHSASSWGYTSSAGGTRTQTGRTAQAGWEWRQQSHWLEDKIFNIRFFSTEASNSDLLDVLAMSVLWEF